MTKPNTFLDDVEKMTDLLSFILEGGEWANRFLETYNYLTMDEVQSTFYAIDGIALGELYRQAENMYIEELNGRKTNTSVDSETVKSVITDYINSGLLSDIEKRSFEIYVESTGC